MSADGDAEESRSALVPTARLLGARKGGRASVVHLPRQWFIACRSRELPAKRGAKPYLTMLFGTPIVLFRDDKGVAGALLDRCPHRNVPLSLGVLEGDGTLTCAYHGWRFDTGGACRFVPSLSSDAHSTDTRDAKARNAVAFPVVEQDGFVWIYSTPIEDGHPPPETRPHRFAFADAADYTTVTQVVEAEGSLYSTLENALDVPHTAFLHRGLFRSESRGITITAKVHRTADRVESEYVGEPRPPGLIGRILSPSGGIVTHYDRFILPSVAQVEYRIGTENHILVDSVMTPVDDFHTRVFAVVSFRARLPHFLIKPFVKPLALHVFKQDAVILKSQTETIRTFGGEQFASTEIDVMGKHIWRLLRTAERGGKVGEERLEVPLVV